MIIYAENITSRLKYIADFIFADILGIELQYINDLEVILDANEPIINYSYDTIDNSFKIIPHGLLDQSHVHEQKTEMGLWDGLPVFFQTSTGGDLPFDILAASFFLVSRYEEYLPHEKDVHGRFEYTQSISNEYNLLKRPVVDEWSFKLGYVLQQKWPELQIKQRVFNHISTIDVDFAWAFKNRPFYRTLGAFCRDLIKADFVSFFDRIKVLTGKMDDPYFTFDFIRDVHQNAETKPTIFIQIGKRGKYDKNISIKNKKLRRFLQDLSSWADIGVHPSYASHDDMKTLKREIIGFREFIGKKEVKSRQHFLRLTMPDTLQNLANIGVVEDYSLGYAGSTGFRSGTCTPHYFYNLLSEDIVMMKLMPLHVMDNSMKKYMKYTPDEGLEEIKILRERVKQVNGTFITLWHNQALSDYRDWEGWRRIFEEMFKLS
ncbi:MAG: polysaccharide deacetylase family protein [Bacteroidales bacterium]|nr:polysaccharide deacetylase family protein [Bacteroidales bacterium]